MQNPDFVPGLSLSQAFYHEAVRPILDAGFPGLPHSAALIGSGSEVLGYDTEMSTDHDWGPRVMLFLAEEEHARHGEAIDRALLRRLPGRFLGYPTAVAPAAGTEARRHGVAILTAQRFFADYLGFDLRREIEA